MFFIKNIRKIAIIGGPGTGKTTLSHFLAKQYFLPLYHIDEIKYSQNWQRKNKEKVENTLLAITQKQKWIIEGNSKIALSTILHKADFVIFLDFSLSSQLLGILKRFFLV